ncbi:MAG: flagellar hook-length control protein FliK [Rhodobacteraceae bacterium]|nr:flagellar hook-length control protein FliK [Paracoccaceae bacterium]
MQTGLTDSLRLFSSPVLADQPVASETDAEAFLTRVTQPIGDDAAEKADGTEAIVFQEIRLTGEALSPASNMPWLAHAAYLVTDPMPTRPADTVVVPADTTGKLAPPKDEVFLPAPPTPPAGAAIEKARADVPSGVPAAEGTQPAGAKPTTPHMASRVMVQDPVQELMSDSRPKVSALPELNLPQPSPSQDKATSFDATENQLPNPTAPLDAPPAPRRPSAEIQLGKMVPLVGKLHGPPGRMVLSPDNGIVPLVQALPKPPAGGTEGARAGTELPDLAEKASLPKAAAFLASSRSSVQGYAFQLRWASEEPSDTRNLPDPTFNGAAATSPDLVDFQTVPKPAGHTKTAPFAEGPPLAASAAAGEIPPLDPSGMTGLTPAMETSLTDEPETVTKKSEVPGSAPAVAAPAPSPVISDQANLAAGFGKEAVTSVPSTGHSSASPSAASSNPAPPTQQVSTAIALFSRDQPGQMELTLAPETLGRVHFDMRPEGTGLSITLSAERPETLDLIRRHLPDLLAELKLAGVQSGNLSFGNWNEQRQPQSQSAPPDDTRPALKDASTTARPAPLPPRLAATNGGLDLRL